MLGKIRSFPERLVLTLAGLVENRLMKGQKMDNAPTFIIGPPRSGTTLLGQVVCHALDVSYIPNLAIRLRKSYLKYPPLVFSTHLAKLLGYTTNSNETFQSYYGSSRTRGGSSDSDFIWRDVLPMGYLDREALSDKQKRYIYRTTSGVEQVFNRPFVDKCVGHSLRIPALLDIFPDALFVRCRRDPLAVAQSVYFERTRNEYTRKTWLTPHARGYEELFKKDLLEQCAGQQKLFDLDIDAGLSELSDDRWIEVDYDNVCKQPVQEVGRIMGFMQKHGIDVQKIRDTPETFPHSNIRRVDEDVYENLIGHLERIYGAPISRLLEASD